MSLCSILVLLIASCSSLPYHIKWENPEEIELKLKDGADPNAKKSNGTTLLMIAAEEESIEAARILIAYGADVSAIRQPGAITALRIAVEKNSHEIITLLLDNGADVNQANEYGWTALMSAAKYASEDIITLLIERGANVFAKTQIGRTPRRVADEENQVSNAILLKSYEDIQRQQDPEDQEDTDTDTDTDTEDTTGEEES